MIEGLRRRVDLVVVVRAGEADELDNIIIEPASVDGQEHAAVLKPVAAGVQAHNFIRAGRRFVLDDLQHPFIHQILNELGAGALVLDQDLCRAKPFRMSNDRTLEMG
jgi:hypothetical protein